MHEFHGKTALITGGTSGIGRATALAAARAGANVVITGRRVKEGEAVAEEIRKHKVRGQFVQGDVTDEQHIQHAVRTAASFTGRLDFALNNAGLELGGLNTVDATAEHYRKVFDVNVLGVLLSMKHQIRSMLATGGQGYSIVNVSSVAGRIGMPGVGIYIASKHAVLGLTKSAALETAQSGIRINSLSPAAIETEMFDRFTGGQPQNIDYMRSLHPIGRVGTAEEVANPALFLFSSDSSFMTGHDLLVDGGVTVP
jgi:NAD(P)-dependent dehydrogenase (short-subunit alcohol dehydrogenase family)